MEMEWNTLLVDIDHIATWRITVQIQCCGSPVQLRSHRRDCCTTLCTTVHVQTRNVGQCPTWWPPCRI